MKASHELKLKHQALWREQAFVAGLWVDADDAARIDVQDPATGRLIGHVPACGAAETRRAIQAARDAQPGWAARSAKERAKVLRHWFDLMMANQEDLARIMTLEQGKPLAESRGEIAYAASFLEWFGEEAKRAYGDLIPAHSASHRISVLKQPVGVCAAITPWNFPSAMIARKVAPALAAGCAIVVKPSELTPYSALAMAVLAEQAGVPAGLLSIVTGPAEDIGGELTGNPVVRKLSFTGSTAVGKRLMAQCSGTVKRLSLELGGNAPFIVFDDADLEAAVAGALASKYRNAGQTCICANRMLIQDGIYDRFAQALTEAATSLPVGNGLDPGVRIGPLIDDRALAKVRGHVEDALAQGARLMTGGSQPEAGGRFYSPTVLTEVTREMRLFSEETFGPVAPLLRFATEADAVQLANATEFGLAAYVYSRDIGRITRVSEALEYGMVGVNEGLISTEVAPFGGIKQSGFGSEGSHYGLEEYLSRKYVCLGGL
jgi:succinate-semialdehyde dehydrogenase/glutarate-semialdehyde dehydrogenase